MMATRSLQHILICITGGIAAYKSLSLIRLFIKHGCKVKVVATANALRFVTPLTIETLSKNKLHVQQFDTNFTHHIDHISLAEWADVLVVAPATANIIAKYAHGIADDLLSTLLIATQKPVFIAPAMNNVMFAHDTVQENIALLRKRGCYIIDPVTGELACGTDGIGKMQEPDRIFEKVIQFFESPKILSGKKALVTAGPTYEPIDPVRFIGNHASGLMGFALAQALADYGASVVLITGPTTLNIHHANIQRIDVQTAEEMRKSVFQHYPLSDISIMAAAVADYTPQETAKQKIKKEKEPWNLHLVPTCDILAEMGKVKRKDQLLVGFALETENELENAFLKLKNKKADFIVLNSLRNEGTGFKTKTNQVTIITKEKKIIQGEKKDKYEVAKDILDIIIEHDL